MYSSVVLWARIRLSRQLARWGLGARDDVVMSMPGEIRIRNKAKRTPQKLEPPPLDLVSSCSQDALDETVVR